MKSNKCAVCSECDARLEEYCGQYICLNCGKVHRKVVDEDGNKIFEPVISENKDEQSKLIEEKENRFKEKKPYEWKIAFKNMGIIIGVTVACILLIAVVVMGIVEISQKKTYNEEANIKYEEIYEKYSDKEYYSALSLIEDFKDDYDDNKTMMSKVSDLSDEIESELYNKIKSANIAISECNTYLEFYPNGKYVSEVEESLAVFTEKQAVQDISEAKKAIQNNKFVEADSILQSIIDNKMISENTKKQAQEVLAPIANMVLAEKGKKAIFGSWTKETGVTYTFEEDGYMSVSMSSNYNSSAGTALDGREVLSLLSEIEDFSRIVRGGTWKYVGTQTSDSGMVYVYSLFYYSSRYNCIIPVDNSYRMGIYLSSGIGDMSILTK